MLTQSFTMRHQKPLIVLITFFEMHLMELFPGRFWKFMQVHQTLCSHFDIGVKLVSILNNIFNNFILGEFVGDYKGHQGNGELLEMTGFTIVSVTSELKITDIKVFFKPEKFLEALQGDKVKETDETLRA